MTGRILGTSAPWLVIVAAAFLNAMLASTVSAQQPRETPRAAQERPVSAQERPAIDLTGYWVSVVTEDWRWRMVTPSKGDYAMVPLNAEGRAVANAWDPARDAARGEACQ